VVFAAGNTALGTANLVASTSGAVATFILNGASLAVGIDTITANFTATAGLGSSL
jgi:hypothetical protein